MGVLGAPLFKAVAARAPGQLEGRLSRSSRRYVYPPIDDTMPGVRLMHHEPPVYLVSGFLTESLCDLLVQTAEGGMLEEVAYENSVLIDVHRLWPLSLVVTAGAAFKAWHGAHRGDNVLQTAATGAAEWTAVALAAVAATQAAAQLLIGKVFTGTKWAAGGLEALHPARPAVEHFVRQTCRLLGTAPAHLEPPTVTRYLPGQYQRVHFDGRSAGDPGDLPQFMQRGGQRLVQVLCYLNTLSPEQGGATQFHHAALAGLAVQPCKGDALVFFPAFTDGALDDRMAHSGEPVVSGLKWNLNTWVCQRPTIFAEQ